VSSARIVEASLVQKSMWAACHRHRTMPLNLMILPWRVRGVVDPDLLQDALRDVVARHPTLRSMLHMQAGQLVQVTEEQLAVELKLSTAQGPDAADREADARRWLCLQGQIPLDITAEPPLRAHLVRIGPEDWIFCLFVHHAMFDGWSSAVLVRDLAAFYEGRLNGEAPHLAPLGDQVADLAAAQLRTYEAGGFDREAAYWRDELSGLPPPIALPTLVPRKGQRDFRAESPAYELPPEVLGAVKSAAKGGRVSHFALLLALLAVLLRRETGQADMLIGVPTLNRWTASAMHVVGCATSLLPARIRLHEGMTLTQAAQGAHQTIRRLLAHGRLPLELILRELALPPGGTLLTPVWCQSRETLPPVRLPTAGLEFTFTVIERGALQGELDVDMLESAAGLRGEFVYRPSLFAADAVHALMQRYAGLVCTASQQMESPIDELEGAA
jgi:hypothetical protein